MHSLARSAPVLRPPTGCGRQLCLSAQSAASIVVGTGRAYASLEVRAIERTLFALAFRWWPGFAPVTGRSRLLSWSWKALTEISEDN